MPGIKFTLFQRFFLYLVVISVLPLLLLGSISFQISRSTIETLSDRLVFEVLAGKRDVLEQQISQIEDLAANLTGIEGIVDSLRVISERGDVYTRLATQAQIGYILNGYLNVEGLVSIEILSRDGRHFYVGETLDVAIDDPNRARSIFTRAGESDRPVHWFGVVDSLNDQSTHRQVFSAAKIIWGIDRNTVRHYPIAVVVINFSLNYLRAQFGGIDIGEGGEFMILDGRQRFLYHPDKDRVGARAPTALLEVMSAQAGCGPVSLYGTLMDVRSFPIARSNWQVVAAIPVATLTAPAILIGWTTAAVLLICLIVVAIAACLYYRHVVSPIRGITERFRARCQSPNAPFEHLRVSGSDEIADLAAGFNAFMQTEVERRAWETALRISEERYSLAMRGANDGLWDWDLDTNMLYLSPRWFQMVGLDSDAAAGQPAVWLSRVHPDDRPDVDADIQAHLRGRTEHFESEHRIRHADGSWVWFLARGLAVRDPKGDPQRMAGSCTDITEMKTAAAALIQARDSAEAANRSKSEFLAMMSHEFRTPLNAIIGFSEMMSAEVLGPIGNRRYTEYVHDITISGQRLLTSINMILDLSKIDAGRLELKDERVDLADLVLVSERLLATMAHRAEVTLRCRIPADLPPIRGDASRIEQSFTNLLSNAVKASHRGGIVDLSAWRTTDGGVLVTVADRGIGMNPAEIEIALTPFGQVSSGYGRTNEGTGLGLPLSKRIIERHGGALSVDSRPGWGTTICVTFPPERVAVNAAAVIEERRVIELHDQLA